MSGWVSPAATAARTLAGLRLVQKVMPDLDDGRLVAEADAGRPHDPDLGPEARLQSGQKLAPRRTSRR